MSTSSPGKAPSEPRVYSPFWGLFAFMAALIYLQATYVVNDYIQLREMKAARVQMQEGVSKAQLVTPIIEGVSGELLAMASESREAAAIVAEFKIQSKNQAGSAR